MGSKDLGNAIAMGDHGVSGVWGVWVSEVLGGGVLEVGYERIDNICQFWIWINYSYNLTITKRDIGDVRVSFIYQF